MRHVCIKHCLGVYEQNSIVNSVGVDDWIAEWELIAKDLAEFPSWLSKEVQHCYQISWLKLQQFVFLYVPLENIITVVVSNKRFSCKT